MPQTLLKINNDKKQAIGAALKEILFSYANVRITKKKPLHLTEIKQKKGSYNITDRQQQQQAAKDHAAKLVFEGQLLRQLRPKFDDIATDFHRTYARTGTQPDLFGHQQDIDNILQVHYGKVADRFSDKIRRDLGQPEDNLAQISNDIDLSTQIHARIRANQSTQIITQTTQNDMHVAVTGAIVAAAVAGVALSNRQVANRAKLTLQQRLDGRLPLIAMTETQNPAEQAKQSEIGSLAKFGAVVAGINMATAKKFKKWQAILDRATREAHALADEQIVPFDQPFIVMGQQLMYPGDTSLGATLDNIINCRCSLIVIIR